MRLIVDLDGPVIDSLGPMLALVNRRFGTLWREDHVATWETAASIGKKAADWMWGPECFGDPAVQASFPATKGALAALAELERRNDSVFFLTDRPAALYAATRAWLDAHGLDRQPLIFARPLTKAQVASRLGADFALDDAPHNAVGLAKVVGDAVLLWDAAYNRETAGPRIRRMRGWDEVMAQIEWARVERKIARRW